MTDIAGRKIIASLLAASLLAIPGVYTSAQQEEAAGSVRVIVEMENAEAQLPVLPAGRKSGYHALRLGSETPRTYRASGRLVRAPDLRRWQVVEVAQQDAAETLAVLQSNPAVAEAHIENIYQTATIPNDTNFSSQYGLHSTANPLADINAPEAWDTTTGSSSTVIAIIDSGVDLNHEDLRDKIWVNADEVAGNNLDDDGNGFVDDVKGWDFIDNIPAGTKIHPHATHVAGIAAANTNNSIGVSGVDWNAQIMSIRSLAGGSGGEASIIRGIQYAVANGADIINMSLVGSQSQALGAAIENAYAAGVVIVAAAGNTGSDTGRFPLYPVCADRNGVNMVLGVAATDSEGEPARFSAYGACVDIASPGDDIYSTKTGDRYGQMSGTSMSAPFAAGVAGLYLSLHPSASPSEVISALRNGEAFTGSNASNWNSKYKGKLNAAAVVSGSVSNSSNSAPASEPQSGGESSGGGSGDSGGGGGGGGGEEPAPEPTISPTVAGAKTVAPKSSLIAKINALFNSVFGRKPLQNEHLYWQGRVVRGEKKTADALRGAMMFQKLLGRTMGILSAGKVAGVTTGSSLVPKINAIHRQAYGRNPTLSEHTYWLSRITAGDKTTDMALLGAMIWHRVAGITH